jgi:hypothetical protein
MQHPLDQLKTRQLELFHPPRQGPDCRTLPPEVERRIVQLLARLLQEHHARRPAAVPGQEVRDE